MSRKPIIAGNWKMNLLQADAKALFEGIKSFTKDFTAQQLPTVVIAPVFTSLNVVETERCNCGCGGDKIAIAGQNCHWEKSGAFTGEVSVEMLADAGCSYVIIGHSERRQYFSETDEMINKKVKSALQNKLIPILCCGETLEERNSGIEKDIIEKQIRNALDGISKTDIEKVIIAYEPIWAIGTGLTASSDDAENMIKFIRDILADIYENLSVNVRIQYGGSVKPDNIKDLMQKENVDGALVGGACLESASFRALINYNL